jgi:mRNA interferase MazF
LLEDAEPLRIRVDAQDRLKHDSELLIDQLRAIDNRRLTEGPLMQCSKQLMARVHMAIRDVLEM